MDSGNPVLIEITRGNRVESWHRGAAAVIRADGTVVASWGDIDRRIYPRSAVKPLQALPLLETGAADRLGVGDSELALACASHSGEAEHVELAAAWLCRLGLSAQDLICGPHPPFSEEAAKALVRRGEEPSPLHNNCSGKHAGFLTTALYLRESTTGYGGTVHPVQLRVRRTVAQMAGIDVGDDMLGIDGCGVPTFAIPLWSLARCMALLADPGSLGRLRAEAVRRVVAAMTAHPLLIAGRNRFDSAVIGAGEGTVVVKGGAEGVHAAFLPERGLGFAVKIDDGANRAAEAAMAAILARFGGLPEPVRSTLSSFQELPLRNTQGARIGALRVAAGWLD
jgi:L-asparaginase II